MYFPIGQPTAFRILTLSSPASENAEDRRAFMRALRGRCSGLSARVELPGTRRRAEGRQRQVAAFEDNKLWALFVCGEKCFYPYMMEEERRVRGGK